MALGDCCDLKVCTHLKSEAKSSSVVDENKQGQGESGVGGWNEQVA